MNLYSTKGAVNARLAPLVDRLARAGLTPDQVMLAAVPVAVVGGACLLVSLLLLGTTLTLLERIVVAVRPLP